MFAIQPGCWSSGNFQIGRRLLSSNYRFPALIITFYLNYY